MVSGFSLSRSHAYSSQSVIPCRVVCVGRCWATGGEGRQFVLITLQCIGMNAAAPKPRKHIRVCRGMAERRGGHQSGMTAGYFNPYTSISPRGFEAVVRSWPVEMYALPLATTGELNLIP